MFQLSQRLVRYTLRLKTFPESDFFNSYLFDIFLGPSYNQSPPSVKYMTVSRCYHYCLP